MTFDQHPGGPRPGGEDDPTLVRNQPALRTPHRRRWLIPGTILAAVAIGMLAWTLQLQILLPWTGIILVAACYIAMLVVATTVREPRRRDRAFAWLMAGMTFAALLALTLIVVGEWRGIP